MITDNLVPAGIDGEAVKLQPPLRFHIRPGVLRVRIARQHPGASPSAMMPEGIGQSARALARIAINWLESAPDAAGNPIPTLPIADQACGKGELMDIFEVEQKERLGREEVATRLRSLADMLARHNDIEFERGGMRFTVHVPDEVDLKLEFEVESDACELEIELSW